MRKLQHIGICRRDFNLKLHGTDLSGIPDEMTVLMPCIVLVAEYIQALHNRLRGQTVRIFDRCKQIVTATEEEAVVSLLCRGKLQIIDAHIITGGRTVLANT